MIAIDCRAAACELAFGWVADLRNGSDYRHFGDGDSSPSVPGGLRFGMGKWIVQSFR